MTGQNVKKKYLMCQIQTKMLKQHANPNSSLQNLKIYSSKDAENIAKDELCMQLTQQFQNFEFSAEDIASDHEFLLRLVKTFTVYTEEYIT